MCPRFSTVSKPQEPPGHQQWCWEHYLTFEQRAEMVRLYITPLPDGTWRSARSVAAQYGVSPTLVYYHVRRAGQRVRSALETRGDRACKPITNVPIGDAPPCKCGCGHVTPWHRRKNRWCVYVPGHYRQHAPYKDEAWLRDQYEAGGRTAQAIAVECGVIPGTVRKFLQKFGIRIRSQPEALALSGGVRGERNGSWKGGIAKWEYAPDWKRIARRIRKRDGYTCQMCRVVLPKSSRLLHVHHIDADKFNNIDANLVTVCASCHPKGERRERAVATQLR